MIEVIQPGLLTTVQDLGRNGYQAYGVPRSGALDPFLASIANKLVGNTPDAPLLEFALVGPNLRFHEPCWVAVVAFGCNYALNARPVEEFSAQLAPAGSTLQFHGMDGWFGYLAFGGGLQTQRVLGSASTYLAGKIGDRLARNQQFQTGPDTQQHYSIRTGFLGFRTSNILPLLPAFHTDLFSEHERYKIADVDYTLTMNSNRMGIYLEGASIESPQVRRSVPAFPGTIQIPQSRQPIILGPEGPTTGGYPQIGILAKTGWTLLAQLRPGKTVRFEWTEAEQASRVWSFRNQILAAKEAWEPI